MLRMCAAVAVMLVSGTVVSDPLLLNVEEAAEVSQLQIQQQSADSGVIYARICDYCERLRLTVDAQTQITRRGARLTLEQARAVNAGATVMFEPRSGRVTRISFWN